MTTDAPGAPAQTLSAAVYVRVSSEEQARKGVSLDAQEAACLRYCVDRGFAVSGSEA